MSDIAIKVEGLSKCYLVGHKSGRQERYTALRDVIARNAKDLARKTRDMLQGRPIVQGDAVEEFWALKDLNFEIKRGERVGIIGRNGAGKSTLLKILSRITEPTKGRVEIRGRVASLLEVGTGFHPELTGRENIYLNGAILGMSQREIRAKFDEIVDFAEVERFLDTPVKRYSSGMYVRLAFSVAAHLEPEILVVDEVLAVGDIGFQNKCLGKMDDISRREGRTVLLVSHQMSAIRNLCRKCLVFDRGEIIFAGGVDEAISLCSSDNASASLISIGDRVDRRGSGLLRFVALEVASVDDGPVRSGVDVEITLRIRNLNERPIRDVVLSIDICDQSGTTVLMQRSSFQNVSFYVTPGESTIRCRIRRLPLCVGTYHLTLFSAIEGINPLDWVEYAGTLTVEAGSYFTNGTDGMPSQCKVLNEHDWVYQTDSQPMT